MNVILRSEKNKLAKEIGTYMQSGEKEKAEELKEKVREMNEKITCLEEKEISLEASIKEKILIPNIIDASVPIGEDDSKNVEIEKFGEPIVPDYEILYHADIIEKLNGLDKESSVRTLECCSGDLADLKVKYVEAWSSREQKYFEVGSCSTLGDAQARRLGIHMKDESGTNYVSTLNNLVVSIHTHLKESWKSLNLLENLMISNT